MLFAVLFDGDDRITAIAPACEQQPYGNRYWTEIYAGQLSFHAGWQTAYVEITDIDLIDRLARVPYDDSQLDLCSQQILRRMQTEWATPSRAA